MPKAFECFHCGIKVDSHQALVQHKQAQHRPQQFLPATTEPGIPGSSGLNNPSAYFRQPTIRPAVSNQQPPVAANQQPPVAKKQRPSANQQPPTARKPPVAVNQQPPVVNRQPPSASANHQPPAANSQPPSASANHQAPAAIQPPARSEPQVFYSRRACPFCNKAFASAREVHQHHLEHHIVQDNGRVAHVCPRCKLKFSRRDSLIVHWKQKHHLGGQPLMHRCFICARNSQLFATPEALQAHIQQEHEQSAERSAHFGFQQTQVGFGGTVSTYTYPLTDLALEQRQSFQALYLNQRLMTSLVQLVQREVLQHQYMKVALVVRATFNITDGQGYVKDRVENLPLRASNFSCMVPRLRYLPQILFKALHECRLRSEELESLPGSGWTLVSINSVTVELIKVHPLLSMT